jgi:hypothetical protein
MADSFTDLSPELPPASVLAPPEFDGAFHPLPGYEILYDYGNPVAVGIRRVRELV